MNEELIEKIINSQPLTNKEVDSFLKYSCNLIKEKYQINNPNDTNCKVCFEASRDFAMLMLLKYNCDTNLINIKELLNIPLTHYISILFLNVSNVIKPYLIDLTYSQFFGNEIILDDRKKVLTKNTFKKLEEDLFVKELRINSFIELNGTTTKKYFDLFLDTCRVMDKSKAYYKVNQLLKSHLISNSNHKKR